MLAGCPLKSIAFQLIDVDHFFDKSSAEVVIRLFGVTNQGNSIAVCAPGYRPYFYASAPKGFVEGHVPKAIQKLNANIRVCYHIWVQ
jgi:hypothetical protein